MQVEKKHEEVKKEEEEDHHQNISPKGVQAQTELLYLLIQKKKMQNPKKRKIHS